MDRYTRLILALFLLILSSCAQVEAISGGPKDDIAPKVRKINPENKSTLFTSKTITYAFDEFIKLNNPQENLVILPAGPKVTASVFKKELRLEIEGDLAPNTTYQISMNGLVKDNREGNDSLMHYVFSTGELLDSISYSGQIVDAYTNEVLSNITVGLYQAGDSIQGKPLYFVKTDKGGVFQFEHLKPGSFNVYAFSDLNKDLQFQYSEKVGFSDSLISTMTSKKDSIALRLFQQALPPKIKDKKLVYPKQLFISSTYSLENASITYMGQNIDRSMVHFFKDDSIAVLLPLTPAESNMIEVKSATRIDTVSFMAIQKNLNQKPSSLFFPADKNLSKNKNAFLLFSDEIQQVSQNLIIAQTKDSISVKPNVTHSKNKLLFSFPDTLVQELSLLLDAGAISFLNGSTSDKTEYKLRFDPPVNFGSLIFKPDDLPANSLVEIILGKQVIVTKSKADLVQNPIIPQLDPGEYSFRLIHDENQNGKWDPGNVFLKTQAEKISNFGKSVKIRANWETEVELESTVKPN